MPAKWRPSDNIYEQSLRKKGTVKSPYLDTVPFTNNSFLLIMFRWHHPKKSPMHDFGNYIACFNTWWGSVYVFKKCRNKGKIRNKGTWWYVSLNLKDMIEQKNTYKEWVEPVPREGGPSPIPVVRLSLPDGRQNVFSAPEMAQALFPSPWPKLCSRRHGLSFSVATA